MLLCDTKAVQLLVQDMSLINTAGILCSTDMPDSVIDINLTEIELFLTRDAFQHLCQTGRCM